MLEDSAHGPFQVVEQLAKELEASERLQSLQRELSVIAEPLDTWRQEVLPLHLARGPPMSNYKAKLSRQPLAPQYCLALSNLNEPE